jgi:hypothetical protein
MSRESTLEAFSNLKREAGMAPHKPLLALFVLDQWLHVGSTSSRFMEIEQPLGDMIRHPVFGAALSATARDPFWFLQTDGIWVVESATGPWRGSARPNLEELRHEDARGRFTTEVVADLQESPGLVIELIGRLLCIYFERTQQGYILERLGWWKHKVIV